MEHADHADPSFKIRARPPAVLRTKGRVDLTVGIKPYRKIEERYDRTALRTLIKTGLRTGTKAGTTGTV